MIRTKSDSTDKVHRVICRGPELGLFLVVITDKCSRSATICCTIWSGRWRSPTRVGACLLAGRASQGLIQFPPRPLVYAEVTGSILERARLAVYTDISCCSNASLKKEEISDAAFAIYRGITLPCRFWNRDSRRWKGLLVIVHHFRKRWLAVCATSRSLIHHLGPAVHQDGWIAFQQNELTTGCICVCHLVAWLEFHNWKWYCPDEGYLRFRGIYVVKEGPAPNWRCSGRWKTRQKQNWAVLRLLIRYAG